MIETTTDEQLRDDVIKFQENLIKMIFKEKVSPTVAINALLGLAFKNIYMFLKSEEKVREGVIMSLESFLRQMAEIEEKEAKNL